MCRSLKSITLPCVPNIGFQVFYGCSSLDMIEIPEGTKSIDKEAFVECSSLRTLRIPNSITCVAYGAFYGCDSLKEIYLPENQVERFSYREDLPNVKLIVVDK